MSEINKHLQKPLSTNLTKCSLKIRKAQRQMSYKFKLRVVCGNGTSLLLCRLRIQKVMQISQIYPMQQEECRRLKDASPSLLLTSRAN
ncbi:hypothetical protein FGO68_gene7845 [Halteria grandinella]|uniref:Uncharacterized protein n=1 Tax=Halteria grandinella TaxID=5974 RepID=A0A8J8NA33_HALGN|nr:hypothetical protein FGO68_gene7845 [Halteria grandinella]